MSPKNRQRSSGAKLARKLGAVWQNRRSGRFGLFGLCIPAVLIIFSLRIMRFRPAMLRNEIGAADADPDDPRVADARFLFRGNWECSAPDWADGTGISIAEWLVSVIERSEPGCCCCCRSFCSHLHQPQHHLDDQPRRQRDRRQRAKVGEAVSTTAAGILSHEAKQTDDAKPETKSKKGKKRSTTTIRSSCVRPTTIPRSIRAS